MTATASSLENFSEANTKKNAVSGVEQLEKMPLEIQQKVAFYLSPKDAFEVSTLSDQGRKWVHALSPQLVEVAKLLPPEKQKKNSYAALYALNPEGHGGFSVLVPAMQQLHSQGHID